MEKVCREKQKNVPRKWRLYFDASWRSATQRMQKHSHKAGLIAANLIFQWQICVIDTPAQVVSRLASSSWHYPRSSFSIESLLVSSVKLPTTIAGRLQDTLLVKAMKMMRLNHVCMSVTCLKVAQSPFHWAILGRFDQRLHKQGKCILHRH